MSVGSVTAEMLGIDISEENFLDMHRKTEEVARLHLQHPENERKRVMAGFFEAYVAYDEENRALGALYTRETFTVAYFMATYDPTKPLEVDILVGVRLLFSFMISY
jgi:hypothetical protein